MKRQWLVSLGIAAAISLSACSGGAAQPTAAPAAPTSAAAPTTAPQATAAPTSAPTSAPTTAPTMAPTTVPTTAPTATGVSETPTAGATVAAATTTPAATTSASAAPAANGPDVTAADVQKMGDAWSKVKTFRIKSESGSKSQIQGEFVLPDRNHVTVSAGGQTIEEIQIGTDTYVKINGTWTKHTASAPQAAIDPGQLVKDFNTSKQSGTNITKGSVRTVNGNQCQDWVSTDSSGTTSVCVGVSDFLPYQINSGDGQSIVDFYDYNASINIQAPI